MPDIGGFNPIMAEDARIVSLLSEADALSDTDPDAASRNLLQIVAPRARANAEAAARVSVSHPEAVRLRGEMVRLTNDRAASVEAYGHALASHDTAQQLAVIHQQRLLEDSMGHFEQELVDARNRPADHGCSVAVATPTR